VILVGGEAEEPVLLGDPLGGPEMFWAAPVDLLCGVVELLATDAVVPLVAAPVEIARLTRPP
jgi:hypothetical protein